MAPGSISSLNFISGPNIPSQALGTHFHAYSSGCLLDFVTPAVTGSFETSLCALDLDTMRWEKLADGKELFNSNYRWHYTVLNQEGTHAWLLGCPIEPPNGGNNGEYLSDVLSIDLRKLGMLGNSLASDVHWENARLPVSDAHTGSHLSGIGADLVRMFDKGPETGSGADYIITATADDAERESEEPDHYSSESASGSQRESRPIHVHRLILEARWPHFVRLIKSQMKEFQTRKMHIPEPFAVVRAFLIYLYTDNITSHPEGGPSLDEVAGMLVMSNIYDMPRLRTLCRSRLYRELDVEHAATIWERAGTANEEWLRRRAARFCMDNWGRVVRTAGFSSLPRRSIMEICQEIDTEGRVVGADELELDSGLSIAKLGGSPCGREGRSRRLGSTSTQMVDNDDDFDDDDNMEY